MKPQYLMINLILIIAKLQSLFMKIRGCQNQAKASLSLFLMTAQVKVILLLWVREDTNIWIRLRILGMWEQLVEQYKQQVLIKETQATKNYKENLWII